MSKAVFAVALAAALGTISCSEPSAVCPKGDTCVTLGATDPIKIASFLDDSTASPTGGTAVNPANGIDDRRGLEIALGLRPKALGHSIQLVGPDAFAGVAPDSAGIGSAAKPNHPPNFRENCNDSDPNLPTNEIKAAAIVADPTIVGAVGVVCTNTGLQVSPIFTAAHVTVLSGNNQGPAVTDTCPSPQTMPATACRPSDSFYFRVSPNGKFQGQKLAAEAKTRGYTNVVTVDDGTGFGHGLAVSFAAAFSGTTTNYSPVTTAAQMDQTIATIKAAGAPNMIFVSITSFGQAKSFITKAKDAASGISSVLLAATNTAQTKDFWDPAQGGIGTVANGVLVTSVNLGFAALAQYTNTFLPAYKALSGDVPPIQNFHGFTFDAYNILVDAIEKVAIKKGGDNGDNAWLIPRQALRDQVLLKTNASGLTGQLNCNDTDPAVGASVGDCSPGADYFKVDTIVCPAPSGGGTCNFMLQPVP